MALVYYWLLLELIWFLSFVSYVRFCPVEDPFLVVVRDSIILGIPLNPEEKNNDVMIPVAGLQNGYDVDFDDSEQIIYWVEHPVSKTFKSFFLTRHCK